MMFEEKPIRKKLMRIIFLISSVVLLVTCTTFFAYEFYKFRETTTNNLSVIGKIISDNSTAALAFDNKKDANEILDALKSEPHIVQACLYDRNGNLFASYPDTLDSTAFPLKPEPDGYHYEESFLKGFAPVMLGDQRIGTLYLKSDLKAINERYMIYSMITVSVIILSLLLTFLISRILQKSISDPILALAETAKVISVQKDYSVRAAKTGKAELALLTDALNQMLDQIENQNQTLSEFNQQLSEKVRELEQFAFVSSHDLQEPLQIISNFVGLLEEKYAASLDKETQQYITFIIAATTRLHLLIKHLLDFSRIGKNIAFQKVDCNKIVKEVIAEADAFIKENNARVTSSVLPVVTGDPEELKQLFRNLINNAIKFHKKEINPEVLISVKEKENEFIFGIKDNGIGIDEKYIDRIFIIFQRLHNITEYPGTGIGLAMCKKIVSLHNGKIWVESKPGQGSTFYFTLPKK